MESIKSVIKKHFSAFVYFYSYLGNKIFIAFFFSIAVSLMDGLGLTMFIPLLQAITENGAIDSSGMGNMGYLVDGLQSLGLSLTVVNILIVMIIFFSLKGISI